MEDGFPVAFHGLQPQLLHTDQSPPERPVGRWHELGQLAAPCQGSFGKVCLRIDQTCNCFGARSPIILQARQIQSEAGEFIAWDTDTAVASVLCQVGQKVDALHRLDELSALLHEEIVLRGLC
ncbi:hypothetical protein EDD94_7969 [Streptomyces sp. PanSC9]|nr:hypothetical protein EDD94_7969 [Streptomyces sp. PanSC9]